MTGRTLRENLVRLETVPMVVKVPSLPALDPGCRVRLAVERSDLIDVELQLRYVASLTEPVEAAVEVPVQSE